MIETATAETFAPHVGSEFAAAASGHEDVLTLVEITGMRAAPEGHRAPFTLIFTGVRTDLRFEHMVQLTHPELGEFALGVVPLRRLPAGNFEYQAGFN